MYVQSPWGGGANVSFRRKTKENMKRGKRKKEQGEKRIAEGNIEVKR
jgi:hypothetical protein